MTLHNHRLLCANAALFRDGRPCELCVGPHPGTGSRHRCYRDSFAASTAAAATIAPIGAGHTWTNHVDLFLALTRFAAERFIAGGLPADRITVKPNFVDDPGSRPRRTFGSETSSSWAACTSPRGSRADRRLGEGGPARLQLVVVGDGPLRGELERRAGPSVRLVGAVAARRRTRPDARSEGTGLPFAPLRGPADGDPGGAGGGVAGAGVRPRRHGGDPRGCGAGHVDRSHRPGGVG